MTINKIEKIKTCKFLNFKLYTNIGIFYLGSESNNSPELSYLIMLAMKEFKLND
jgi:hypothetical protein